jgi:hypothetical protein
MALNVLGSALVELRQVDDAITAHQDAAAIYWETGDRHGQGRVLTNLGIALQEARPGHRARHAHAGTQAPATAAPATSPDDPSTKQRPPARAAHRPAPSGTPAAAPGTLAARRAPGSPEGLAARHQGMAGQAARPFPLSLDVSQHTKSEGNGRSACGNQIYEWLSTSDQMIRMEYRSKVKLVLGFFAEPNFRYITT